MKNLFIVVAAALFLCSCSNDHSSLKTHKQTGRINNHHITEYKAPESKLEEYVSRVGKRVTLVSGQDHVTYNFRVLNTEEPSLEIDRTTHTISLSEGVLRQLQDEAELATVLLLSALGIDHIVNLDRDTATILARAGYDPHAMLDLQEQYFHSVNRNETHWMRTIYPIPLSAGTITSNKIMLEGMPKGLARDEEDYKKQING
jgi:predicted Zn-dependent protease